MATGGTTELFDMVAKPKGDAAIQLTQNIWKIEDELDMLFSYARNGYETYKEEGESGILLRTDGVLIIRFPSEKMCREKFESIKKKIAKSQVLSILRYGKLTLEKYKITKKVEGKLEAIVPKALINFLHKPQQKLSYEPERIFFEFFDSDSHKNFVRITFDKVNGTNKLMLDVSVESNDVKYAKETIQKVQALLKK